jgi:signal transduction histidine kinase
VQTSDASFPLTNSSSLLEADTSALLPVFPPLAPVPPPPFHPARLVRSQPTRDQATLLSPSSHTQPLSADEQVRVIREALQAFAAATQPQDVLCALLRSVKPIRCFTACSVLLRDEAGQYEFSVVAQQLLGKHFVEQIIERLVHVARRYGLPPVQGEQLAQPQVVAAVAEQPDHVSALPAERLAFFLAHPLIYQGHYSGVLGLAEEQAGTVTREQEEFLSLVLDFAGMALENVHLHQGKQRLWEEVQAERQRIDHWKDDFLSTVSHELRTPLTPIKGFTQHLLRRAERKLTEADSQTSDSQARLISSVRYEQRCLETIESEAEHLERLVNTLLDVSLVQRGKLQLRLRFFDLAELIEQTVRSTQLSAEQHDIVLRHTAEKAMVWADRERLRAILGNLLENAMKYSPEGGEVLVSLLEHEQECVVRVSDQGEGVAAEQMASLFERFHQPISPGAHDVEGIGVSLYHAQTILQLHGGRIWAEQHQQKPGATFAFALPHRRSQGGEQACGEARH